MTDKENNAIRKACIEEYLTQRMDLAGGECFRWHNDKNMDDYNNMCFFPNGFLVFVVIEVERQLSPEGKKLHALLDQHGALQYTVSSEKEVDYFMQAVQDAGREIATEAESTEYPNG
jgi:hypothetical protein